MRVIGLAVGSFLPLTVVESTISVLIASCSAFLARVAIILTNEFFSKLQMKYTKLQDWINLLFSIFEETMKET